MSETRLRKVKKEDLEMIRMWRMHPDITKYMNTDPILTIEDQKRWFHNIQQNIKERHWIIQDQGTDIGMLNVTNIDSVNKRCSWGYYIAEKKFRSLKLAMSLEWNLYDYVLYELGLNKLCNEVLGFNETVAKLHLMCGSDKAGVLKQHIHKNNEFHDVILIEICKDKWENIRAEFSYEKILFE